ncbi:polysaccharide pyruvyl transferase family protein [Alteromonas oceani]|uniref:Polysaccharide pyruvyl transferase family protein n=1 Tax=Alteromonas oceani TaxID=2071609 RepID=A0ABV7JZL3_9ALTE|nr:polysaccharide pyruvyl transferase family protein [Alteromonas oceani]
MSNVGIVGIGLDKLSVSQGSTALELSGNNFGNMLFTYAAHRQIDKSENVGFRNLDKAIDNNISKLLVPAANWINLKQDWGWLAEEIEQSKLPCVAVGLGAQLESLEEVSQVPEGTKRLLEVIAERSSALAVRGEFTAEVINKLGVKNVEVLGCPSLFSFGKLPKLRPQASNQRIRIGVGPTRYHLHKGNLKDKQQMLYRFAIREASSIYYQSEAYEIKLLSREDLSENEHQLAMSYYGFSNFSFFERALMEKGKYHTNLNSWLVDVAKDDVYVGTRIHGAIAATLAGTPPLLITHDKRTEELAESMCVPSINIMDFELNSLFQIEEIISTLDFAKYLRRAENNFKRFQQFYKVNDLSFKVDL